MAHANEGGGKGVKKEPPDKFPGGQSHNIALVAGAAVAEGKGDVAVFDAEDAVVGNGDAAGIAAKVVQNFFRSAEWFTNLSAQADYNAGQSLKCLPVMGIKGREL